MSTEQEATPAHAELAKEENAMKAKSKAPKMRKAKTGTVALAKTTMKNREARLKKREKEKVELRTLALRVTNAEFDLVHKAAGPRNLTGFMRTAVLTAAQKHLSK